MHRRDVHNRAPIRPGADPMQQTVLNAAHKRLGARMVDFGGWEMPLSYGSQIDEHHHVRRDAGMFDVSHMTVVDLRGDHVRAFLRHLVANDVDKLRSPGKALYTCMLDKAGGVVDDLIVYFMDDTFFRVVVNACAVWCIRRNVRRSRNWRASRPARPACCSSRAPATPARTATR